MIDQQIAADLIVANLPYIRTERPARIFRRKCAGSPPWPWMAALTACPIFFK